MVITVVPDDDEDRIDNIKYSRSYHDTGSPANSSVDATGPTATQMFPHELTQDDVDAYVEEPIH